MSNPGHPTVSLPDPHTLADRALAHEQRRVRRWAVATAALWVLAASYCALNVVGFLVFFYPRIALDYEVLSDERGRPDVHVEPDVRQQAVAARRELVRYLAYLLLASLVAPLLLLVAGIGTTLFVLRSRRAVLDQIQGDLARLGRQLEVLVAHSHGPPPTA